MLVLSRKLNETLVIGDNIVIKLVKIKGNVIGLGIQAPAEIKIMRGELLVKDAANSSQQPSTTEPNRLSVFTIAS